MACLALLEEQEENTPTIFEEKETYGFKSGNAGPFIPELQDFEKKFWKMIKSTKYFNRPNEFQSKLRQDLKKLKELDKVVIFANKSNKKYCVSKEDYNKELRDQITSTYKKVDIAKVNESNLKTRRCRRIPAS